MQLPKAYTAMVLCTILGLGSSQGPGPLEGSLLLRGGRIETLDPAHPGAATLAITKGRIAKLAAPGAATVDLHGAVVVPGLVDHHVHLFNLGLTLVNDRDHGRLFIDLSGVHSLAEVARLVRARARDAAPGAWIVGAGWSQAAWGTQDLPANDSLNAAAPDNPVLLARTDGHAGWVNARALALAGITASTPDPAGGAIGRIAGGQPSGILLERANELVTPLIPPPSDQDVMAAFQLAAQALAARGVVLVYDAGTLPFPGVVSLAPDLGHFLELLRRADSAAPLPIRVNLMIPAPSRLADSLLARRSTSWSLSPRVRITHLKLFADGALGSRGAALTHPYADAGETSGVPRMTTGDIVILGRRALDAGLGVATHAIGDEAVKRTLDAYEQLLRERPGLDPSRLRIEHFSYAREEDFARAVRLHVVLSIQSNFNSAPGDDPSLGAARLGAANEPRVYAWDRLQRMGARLAEGSDYFTRPAEPLAGYLAALTRRNAVGPGRPDAAARLLALRMQTRVFPPAGISPDPALRPGRTADLVILSANPLTAPIAEIPGITVLATINAGRITYATEQFRGWLPRH